MKLQHIWAAIILLPTLWLAGCSAPFTEQDREGVMVLAFNTLQASPTDYVGKKVMYGGQIIAIMNLEKETEVEVLQKPLDSRGLAVNTDKTLGRFLFVSRKYLDPAEYHPGRYITVIGVVRGEESRPIGGMNYNYPIIDEVSHHLWKPGEMAPKVRIGVGVEVGVPIR